MAFQSNAFQGTGFQIRRPDQRRGDDVVLSWFDGVRRDKRIVKIDDDDDLIAIARAFVDYILTRS